MPLRFLLLAWLPAAHAHHAMDYAVPATALDGLLSGLGHPVIGIDHLLFIAAAGLLAAQARRGAALLIAFVAASMLAAALRAGGVATFELHEAWIAASLLSLAGLMLARTVQHTAVLAALFAAGGLVHGHALAASIVGAEPTPLAAYFAGLTVVQCAIAAGGWALCRWIGARWPALPLQRAMGAVLGGAALILIAAA